MNQPLLASILTAGGAILLAVVNHLLTRGRNKIDVATQIREELRKDNASLREQMREAQKEITDCKNKMYALLENQGKLEVANADLKAEVLRLTTILKNHNLTEFL